jgi:ligand-binding sensor domain-containing protein
MWIGTKNGLNLYDGHTFMVFLPNNKNSISNENINDIAEDNKGRIWVATHQGLNLYDPNLHQWSKVEQTLNGDKLPNSIIWDIHIDEFQNLWIVSNVKNLISCNLTSQKINIFDWETYSASSFPEYKNLYRSIQKIAYKSKDEIWLGTNMGLCLLNIKQNKIEYIGGKKRVDMFDVIYLPEKNKVIFSTETNIVYVYDELSKTLKNMEIVRQSYPLNQLFNYDNNSAVSTLFGLGQWDNNFEKLFISEYIPNLSFSLRAGKVNSHYKDKYGNIWIGTSNGISILDIQSKTHFYPLNKCSDNESNNHMGDVIYDEISHTYIVTNPGEHRFYFYQTISGKIIEHINIEGEPIDNITGICKNKKNQIWLFSNLKAYLFNPHTLSFQRIRNINSNYQIRYMSQDFNGNIWLADYSGKIYLYDSLFKPLSTNISELNNGEKVILRILPDKINNGVWFLSFERGISFFSFNNNKITTYDEFKNEQFSLITDISIDKQGIVWISTMKNGISYSYLKNGTIEFQHLSTSDGLPSNNFFNIQSLNLKNKINILLSSNGLKVWPKSNFYYHVPKFTSWGSDLLFTHQFLTTIKNNLLLGVAGGLLWVEPIYKDNNLKTNIISINNQYQFNIHEIKKYNFKENNVSFKFSAFQYTKPNNGKISIQIIKP